MRKGKKISIILEVAILFALSVLTTGALTYFGQRQISDVGVKAQTELIAGEVADEVRMAVRENPAYGWLLRYWYEHADTLDIEYDVGFGPQTRTEAKCRELSERHPELQLRYLSQAQIEQLPEEDQKLYAEITYSWLITRINQIKRSYHMDYLFCVLSDEPYDTQFFLFSAADPDAVRGTHYEEVYPLGTRVEVSESQQEAMRSARSRSSHLADAGKYVDYYEFLDSVDGHTLLIGLTYDLSELRETISSQTWRGTSFAVAHQLALSLLCLGLSFFLVLRPLKKVQSSIRIYQQSKDSESVTRKLESVRSANEIGQLAEDVQDLAREIDDYLENIETITAEKERVSTELNMAKQIQASMLPSTFPAFPNRSEFDIYAVMDPAREVGGDFYDFFLIDEDHLCMVMADVSGKGVPAALFMMASKIILANFAMQGKSPEEILTGTNAAICANNRQEMFVTVWLGVLEISTGRLTACSAGHEYPALKPADGGFALVRDRHGLVIGGMDTARYQQYELMLEPGAKLFLYTDGVPEASDADNNMFGTQRMLDALNAEPDAAPEPLLKNVRDAVDAFVSDAEQFDDLTMLCLEYKGEQHG